MIQLADADKAAMDVLRRVVDGTTARTVFGDPITQDGVTVLPVARINSAGGGGGGAGPQPGARDREGEGTGAGLALAAKPIGVFVIRKGRVNWRPAVDINRVVLGAQVVGIIGLLTLRALARARRRRALTERG